MKKVKENIWRNYLYLIKPFWDHGKMYMLLTILPAILINPLVSFVDVRFTERFIDSVLSQNWQAILFTVLTLQGVYYLGLSVSDIINLLYVPIQYQRLSHVINKAIFQKAQRTDISCFDNPEFYDTYTWTASNYIAKGDNCVTLLKNLLANVFTIATLLFLLTSAGGMISVITVLYVAATTLINIRLAKTNYEKRKASTPIDRKKNYIHSLFYDRHWATDLRITNLSSILFRRYEEVCDEKEHITDKYNRKQLPRVLLSKVLLFAETCLVLLYLAWLSFRASLTVSEVMAMFTAAVSLRRSVTSFVDIYSKIKENSYYASTIRQFFAYQSTIEPSAALLKGGSSANTCPQIPDDAFAVDLENVTFAYDSRKTVLHDLHMHIRPGEKVALIGENGAGKSTILKLLLRLYDPQNGTVKINGVPIQEYDIHALRNRIGVVMQDCDLLAFTVRENMNVYDPCADDVLSSILQQSKLATEENSESVLDSYITKAFDSTGIILSGGQKQKLCICRLFTKKFGLLILDEPTASLDAYTEKDLMDLLYDRANTTTTIFVSHRLSTVKNADKIFVIGAGGVVEYGTHASLMAQKGVYYDMFRIQAANYEIES